MLWYGDSVLAMYWWETHALSKRRHNDEIIGIFDRHPFHQIVNIYLIFNKHLHLPASEYRTVTWSHESEIKVNRSHSFTNFSFVVRKSKTFTWTFCLCQASCSFTKKSRCCDCSMVIIFRVNLGIKSVSASFMAPGSKSAA